MARLLLSWEEQCSAYNFTSSQYLPCIGDVPTTDAEGLRRDVLGYLAGFKAKSWYNELVRS